MKKALIIWGGWDGHNPLQSVEKFAPFLRSSGFEVRMENCLDVLLEADYLKTVSLIVPCWTMGELRPEQEKGLLDAVRNGAGIAGWHGGMCDAFRNSTSYQWMTGGQFVAHPGGQVRYRVRFSNLEHPVTRGLSDFEIESEQYYMHTDPGNRVLAVTTFSGEHENAPWISGTEMPVVWTRQWGEGRVFYCAIGHKPEEFDIPQVGEVIRRGLSWAAR
jgi:type 1 glutamine amidotransferase